MLRSLSLLLILTLSATAGAQGFDYNYLQINYGNIDFDDINADGDGLGLSGSFAVNPDWHVFASYQNAGLDFGIDFNGFAAGVGYNTEMSPDLDLFARLSYQYVELDAPGVSSVDDSGYGFGIGMRYALSQEVEFNAGLDRSDFGDGGDTALSLGGLYNFTDSFSLGLGGSWSDDASSLFLSGRIYFGK